MAIANVREDGGGKSTLPDTKDEVDGEFWDATTTLDMGVDVPAQLIAYVDHNVKAHFPEHSEVEEIQPHGSSNWSRTAKIGTILNGDPVSYFLKVSRNKFGKKMFRGEYEAGRAIYEACPDFCPRPIAWGTYQSVPDTHFFLSSFIDMVDDLPDVHQLPQKVAQMHQRAVALDGRYGFHVQDMCALLPMYVSKTSSWEEFFSNYMRHFMAAENRAQGPPTKVLERLEEVFLNRIVPRLCRPLETGKRQIEPRLLHSDLWDGNSAIHAETGNPIIFDPSCFYGHNEFELGVWRCPRHKTGIPYIEKYHESFPKSAPEEDHEGRMLMYLLAFEVRASACWVEKNDFRLSMIEIMTELDQKYPETYEEWTRARGEPVCVRKGLV